jgi:hypothetical protein
MTPFEQAAFVDAYCANVGDVPRDRVEAFVDMWDSGKDIPYSEDYTSIMDALGLWHSAIQYQIKEQLR